ncbi:MAG: 4-hydroxy-tetrahydrodipicolinate synthase [Gemmatimonadetes bacterium]|nr:MAG: 4-hydroxy-tetrahydrodipicolinate synthase [Gemmatimonadota bacterium]
MSLKRFQGLGVAMVTPFDERGRIDEAALRRHVDFLIEGGAHVLVPCGTTGESATMSGDEQRRVVAVTVEQAAGRVPVMAGAGANATAEAVARTRAVVEAGADAVLTVSPYYNKPTHTGLLAHYRAVAEAAERPVFIYNVPGRTGSNVRPETVLELAGEPHIAGVKEASGDLGQVMTLLRERPDGFLVLSGEDDLTLPMIAAGADGVISVVGNEVPHAMARMCEAALAGDFGCAREIHYRLLALMRANFVQTNPIPVKAALRIMGRMEAHYRLPLTPLDPAFEPVLRDALAAAGVDLP